MGSRSKPPADGPALARWRREVRVAIPRADEDLVEEVAQHVAQRWQSAKVEGLSDEDADGRVRRDLDRWRGVPPPRRERRRAGLAVGWVADARHAFRSLRARPFHASATIVLTTIAVAASVAAFTIIYGILWRPLSYPDTDRLAILWQVRRGEQQQISYPDFADLKEASVLDGAAAIMGGHASLRIGDRIERVNTIGMEAPGFALLGARPLLGRLLNAADEGQPVVMISHRLWRTHLHADANIVGRPLWLSGTTYTVAGVLTDGFDFELPITATLQLEQHDVWRVLDRTSPFIGRRDASTYEALVRLAPATTFERAQVAIDAVAQRLSRVHPGTNAERSFRLVPLKSQIVQRARRPLLLAGLAAVAALAIALANLVTLALVRLTDRRAELAVREALGAGAARLRRQLFTEHLATGVIGGVAGVLLAVRLTAALAVSEAADLPRPDAIRFDSPVLAAATGIVLLMAAVLTLLPLGGSGSASILRAGVRGSRAGRRARRAVVIAELALALALAVTGALVGLSLVRIVRTDPGFSSAGVVSVRVSAFQQRYPGLEHVEAFMRSVLDRIAAVPDVAGVAAGLSLPLSGQTTGTSLVAEGRPVPAGARPQAGWQFVTPGYFDTLGIPIVGGRDFTAADRTHDGHVTIVNEALARTLFGDEDPVGRRITDGAGDSSSDWHVIIGVVGDVRHHALDEAPAPRMYDLFGEHWGRTSYIVVRARIADATPLVGVLRRAIAELDPEAPVFEMSTMSGLVERSAAPYRLAASLAGSLACAAVLLALLGVYAVTAASVGERTREIGIRAAIGAAPRDLLCLVLREGAITAAAGTALGLAASIAATKLLHSQLFGVRAGDITTVVPLACAATLLVATAAAVPAARRAAQADPLVAMRSE